MKRVGWENWAILSLAAFYFLVMAPISLSGAQDHAMMAVFNLDEYSQYAIMLKRSNWSQPFGRWMADFWSYYGSQFGFLFSFVSAVVFLFLRIVGRLTGHPPSTEVVVFVLRQLCVCCFIVGSYFLARVFCGPRDKLRQVLIFAFLLTVPAGLELNVQWKPDQAVYLTVALGLFWISRAMDREPTSPRGLMLGTFFFGMAAGLKAYGWFAGPLILLAAILVWRRHFWGEPVRLLKLGAAFVGGFLVSQPVMIWPPAALNVVKRLLLTVSRSTRADDANRISTYLTSADVGHWYHNSFEVFYGHWSFLVFAIAATVAGLLLDKPRRYRYLAVMVWFVPIAGYVVTQIVYTGEQRYWLPIWMPVLAALVSFCFSAVARWRARRSGIIAGVLVVAVPVAHAATNIRTDAHLWQGEVGRENHAPSILFYQTVDRVWLSKLPKGQTYSVFRDPYIYVPTSRIGLDVRMRYKDTAFSDIVELPTDIALLQVGYIDLNASNENLAQKKASRDLWASYLFYSDVRDDKVKGFRKIYQDRYGIFLVSDALYRRMPSSFWKQR